MSPQSLDEEDGERVLQVMSKSMSFAQTPRRGVEALQHLTVACRVAPHRPIMPHVTSSSVSDV